MRVLDFRRSLRNSSRARLPVSVGTPGHRNGQWLQNQANRRRTPAALPPVPRTVNAEATRPPDSPMDDPMIQSVLKDIDDPNSDMQRFLREMESSDDIRDLLPEWNANADQYVDPELSHMAPGTLEAVGSRSVSARMTAFYGNLDQSSASAMGRPATGNTHVHPAGHQTQCADVGTQTSPGGPSLSSSSRGNQRYIGKG